MGGLTTTFQGKRGIRQGDPMSPYLFMIAMEYLQRELNTVASNPRFKFNPRCKKLGVMHICFADDLLMFCKADIPSIQLLQSAFLRFSTASGLQSNIDKSSIYMSGVKDNLRHTILNTLGFCKGSLPFKYLGRLQLINFVIFGIQTYWDQIFLLPKRIMKMIDSVCRSFLWTGGAAISKKAFLSWAKICLSKVAGGKNIINLGVWNKAAVIKQLWSIAEKKDYLWIKWGTLFDRLASVAHNVSIKKMYLSLTPSLPKVPWKCITMHPSVHPRYNFTVLVAL
ncbi:uncharacterized protein LOC132607721 [Lycium barbarum]|uniref:uncharacterized protein LOC132607721 n=1 Tax=Lycium barbarum TaxID=112863 RepID=UPI00293E75AE|nr:uncharacterized protein LOC132607721 [Lycium barbarum]